MARRRLTPFARGLLLCLVVFLGYWLGRPLYWAFEEGTKGIQKMQNSVKVLQSTASESTRGVVDNELQRILDQKEVAIDDITSMVLQRLEQLRVDGGYSSSLKTIVTTALRPFENPQVSQQGGLEELDKVKLETDKGSSSSSSSPEKEVEKPLDLGAVQKPPEKVTDSQPQGQGEIVQEAVGGLAKGVRPIIHEGRPLLEDMKRKIWDAPPLGTPMPPREEFALRREMVEFRAVDNIVTITFANFAFMEFVTNWVEHLTKVGVNNILVGAMDSAILEGLFRVGIPVFDLESNMPTEDAGWGSPVFHKMGREKVTLINVFLSLGYEIFICDTDTVFLNNPLPYFAKYPTVDVFSSSDELVGGAEGDGLEPYERAWGALNIGVLHFRPTVGAREMARKWSELLVGDDSIWDQNGFNDIMRKSIGPNAEDGGNIVYAFEKKLKLGILPVSMFCSGHTYFVQRKAEKLNLPVYAVHATFQFAGTEGKRHRFREAKLFIDPPAYYAPKGGLLSFASNIPHNLLHGGEHSVVTHFNLVNYQLRVIRQALAIATILGRTLVMPPLWCRFDRFWFEHPGILEGTDTSQPFLCPMDHIFEVQNMLMEKDSNEFGPYIDFREYSFLENERTPISSKSPEVNVEICEETGGDCPSGGGVEGGVVRVPRHMSQSQVESILGALETSRHLHFLDMSEAFGQWDDKPMEKKFRWRISHYLGIWCCGSRTPGHIWYDFFWDEKPDWEAKPPSDWSQDHPPHTGQS